MPKAPKRASVPAGQPPAVTALERPDVVASFAKQLRRELRQPGRATSLEPVFSHMHYRLGMPLAEAKALFRDVAAKVHAETHRRPAGVSRAAFQNAASKHFLKQYMDFRENQKAEAVHRRYP